ncbi:MAG: type II CAAX endopeptidase family protein [Luteolibacter sp.]|jgi:membrane protease YdiL (CAAX protease family)|nr:type II CAAX endopeptidase family protein [Luteolibacter sp.]
MPDPTEPVLTGGFAAAVVLFCVGAAIRAYTAARPPVPPVPGVSPDDEASPYAPPPLPPEFHAGKVPVWIYRHSDLFGVVFVFAVFFGLVLASVRAAESVASPLEPGTLLVNIGFQFLMAGMVVVLMVRRLDVLTWLGLRWHGWPRVFLIAPGTVLFMWLIFGGLQVSGYVEWMESLGVETVQDTVKLLQDSQDPQVLGLMAFAAVIAAPLCEEIVFRGYFYPVLKKFAGVRAAALSSSLVFAAAHGNLAALLPLFIFGGVLVFLYEKTGSLWAPIGAHFCFNSATVVLQMAARYYEIPLAPTP